MNIVYIVDGGEKIGLGHVYQSIAFATILKKWAEIIFLTQSDNVIVNKILSSGFITHKMSGEDEILRYLKDKKPNIVIIDKIDVSIRLAYEIRRMTNIKLVIFTNLTDANKSADIAITADIGSNFQNIQYFDNETKTQYFYGPKYWILRNEFSKYKKRNKEITNTIKEILLIFGGSDPENLTTCTVKELLDQPVEYKINVVIGASFGYTKDFNELMRNNPKTQDRITVLKDTHNVAELMYNADLVIASPGLSAFEALYVGTPILLLPQSELQKETYMDFFKLIDKVDIKMLPGLIAKRDFTFPYQKEISVMEIGEGTKELIEKIIGVVK